jgi:hypothetical protein
LPKIQRAVDEQKEWKTLLAQAQNPLFAHPPGMAHTYTQKNYHRFSKTKSIHGRAQACMKIFQPAFCARSKEKEKTHIRDS